MASVFSGERLRQARKEMSDNGRKVSQDRFAELVGVSQRTPQRWEAGEVEPRASYLDKISEVTGKPIAFFFDDRPFRGTVKAAA